MTRIIDKRMAAQMEGEFVVFLIGMRVNKPWKVHKWLPVFHAMPKMLKELESHPESGFLGHSGLGRVIVQYWLLRALRGLRPGKGQEALACLGRFQPPCWRQPQRCRHLA